MHAFIWQIIPLSRDNSRSFSPGFFWITDGWNFTNIDFFILEYLEVENTSIPNFKRPKRFHILSDAFDSGVDLYLETKNMHEYLWGKRSIIDVGLWEGSCSVDGTLSIGGDILELKGSGFSEILRII